MRNILNPSSSMITASEYDDELTTNNALMTMPVIKVSDLDTINMPVQHYKTLL